MRRVRRQQAEVVMGRVVWMIGFEYRHHPGQVRGGFGAESFRGELSEGLLLLSGHLRTTRRYPDRGCFALIPEPYPRIPKCALDPQAPEVAHLLGLPA